MKKPVPLESEIQKSILELLAYLGVAAWRINVGMIPAGNGEWRRSKMTGMSDIIGILPGGRFLAIEVKRPGGKATVDQLAFLARVSRHGGLAFVASSTLEVEARLKEAV